MNIQLIKLNDVHPYDKNPRKNDKAVDKVAASIKEFGFKVPLVIDKNHTIVTGHTRYRAAKKLGLTEVPCIVADDLTENQINAFRLADNKVSEFAEWDFGLLTDELNALSDINMAEFGFVNMEAIEWAGVEDLSDDTYEEPKKEKLQCPHCGHIDSKNHFKKVNE